MTFKGHVRVFDDVLVRVHWFGAYAIRTIPIYLQNQNLLNVKSFLHQRMLIFSFIDTGNTGVPAK
jgi:hypothetical protein